MFSNARLVAEFNDWPIGGNNRGQCKFVVEDGGKKGKRVVRTTTNKYGNWCKPKYSTYSREVAIVDGDDGKTYILAYGLYGFISIQKHDFMSPARSSITERDADFNSTLELIRSAK